MTWSSRTSAEIRIPHDSEEIGRNWPDDAVTSDKDSALHVPCTLK